MIFNQFKIILIYFTHFRQYHYYRRTDRDLLIWFQCVMLQQRVHRLLAGLSYNTIALSLRRYYFLIWSRRIEVKNVHKRSVWAYTRDFARRIAARYSPAAMRTSYLRTDRLICSLWRPVSMKKYNLKLDIDLVEHKRKGVKDLGKTLPRFSQREQIENLKKFDFFFIERTINT